MKQLVAVAVATAGLVVRAGDDMAEYLAAMEKADAVKSPRQESVSALSAETDSSEWKTYEFAATGDLGITVGEGTLNFEFAVDRCFTDIKSATLTMNAYDVDYPEATERDLVSFNGVSLGRLQGGNNTYHVNSFSLPNPKQLVRCPAQGESSARNTFGVAVDVDDLGWVTKISWATLQVVAKEGLIVEASDGTDLDGIRVTWTEVPGATYTLYRATEEDGSYSAITTTSETEYLDQDVDYARPYFYAVNVQRSERLTSAGRGSFDSNTDSGIKGDDVLPEIESIDVAQLFLTGEGPYNVLVKWNSFDLERYKVDSICFKLSRKGIFNFYTYKTNWHDLRETPDKISEFNLCELNEGATIDASQYGEYELVAYWKIYDVRKGELVKNPDRKWLWTKEFDTSGSPTPAKVYFRKFENDVNASEGANWFSCWRKDGAVTMAGYNWFVPSVKYSRTLSGIDINVTPGSAGEACGVSKEKAEIISCSMNGFRYPTFKLHKGPDGILVSDGAALFADYIDLAGRETIGNNPHVVGVNAYAAVLAHEFCHNDFAFALGHSGKGLTIMTNIQRDGNGRVTGFTPIRPEAIPDLDSLRQGFSQLRPDAAEYANVARYLEVATSVVSDPNSYTMDFDGDGISDYEERQIGKTSPGESDTHGVSRSSSYTALSGDNEYLAWKAQETPLPVNEEKDWAFPGSKIGIGAQACANGANLLTQVKQWLQNPQNKGEPPIRQTQEALAADLKATAEFHGTLAADWRPQQYTCFPGVELIAGSGVARRLSSGTFDRLEFAITLSHAVADHRRYAVRGYLVDKNENPVAWAQTDFTMEADNQTVLLEFYGEDLYQQRFVGYRLAQVLLIGKGPEEDEVLACSTSNTPSDREYSYAEFTMPELFADMTTVTASYDKVGITLSARIASATPGTINVSSRLCGKDGTEVAFADARLAGDDTAHIVFPADDIRLSHVEGPYSIRTLTISANGKEVTYPIDVLIDCTRMDFSPDERWVAVDEASFGLDSLLRGIDGKVNVARFGFKAVGLQPEESLYVVSADMFSTNGAFVASTESRVVITNGVNEIVLTFDGARIASSPHAGAYVISAVELRPEGGGVPERFFPTMEPLDLNPEDFGCYPFELADEPTVQELSGGSAYAVTVPLRVLRPNTVTVSALLVDANGQYVATAKKTIAYGAPTEQAVTVEFSEADIAASGRRGPYTIRYLTVSSDLEGIAPLRVTTFREEGLVRDYVLYVDDDATDDGGDGRSWLTAKRTIQAAVNEAQDGDIVRVADGIYEPFTCDNKSIRIEGVYGYARTVIDGGGTNRCATLGREESQTNTVLRGFTLTNGDATTGNVLLLWNCGGGSCCGSVYDCKISDCTASKGGGAYYGRLESCLLTGNYASTYGGGSYYGERVNCTICGNAARSDAGGTYYGVTRNSIVWNNAYGGSRTYDDNWYGGTFSYSLTDPMPSGEGNLSGEPGFTDEEGGDYSLSRDSICIDAGDDSAVAGEKDLGGSDRIMGEAVDIGAFERLQRGRTYGVAEFAAFEVTAKEGELLEIEVWGGRADAASSVELHLAYGSAVVKDLDLAKGAVNGMTPKGGLKFPLRLTWRSGDFSSRIVTIPVATDKDAEGDELMWAQLAAPRGIELGDARLLPLNLADRTIPGAVTLSQGVNNPALKVATSGAGKWTVGDDAGFWAEDRGIYNLESPQLTPGKSSTLTLSGISGGGELFLTFGFSGDEYDGSSLTVYAGKERLRNFTHSSEGNGWWKYSIVDVARGAHTYSFVFTQGRDPTAKVRVVSAYWVPSGAEEPAMLWVSTGSGGGGYVTGMGYYAKGALAKPTAVPYPGYAFDAWYRWSDESDKYVEFSRDPKLTFRVMGTDDLMASFVAMPYAAAVAEPANAGKVTGFGYTGEGKKVTLKATANKGFVFMGWEADGEIVTQKPTLLVDRSKNPAKNSATQYVLTELDHSTTFRARFITTEMDKACIAARVNGISLEPWTSKIETHAAVTNVWAGVYLEWPIAVSALSETTVKVSGLPAGLKFTTKPVTSKIGSGRDAVVVTNVLANTIYGAPTTPSKAVKAKDGTVSVAPSAVLVTVTTAGKSSQSYQIDTTVDSLPERVQGTFFGGATNGVPGSATLTVAPAGKISGKWIAGGLTWTLTANSFDTYDAESDAFAATLTAKSGKLVETLPLVVGTNGCAETYAFEALWANWKVEPWKSTAKAFNQRILAYETDGGGWVTLKFSAAGTATVTGEFPNGFDRNGKPVIVKATGSATLVPTTDGYMLFVYLAPYGLPVHARFLNISHR